MSSPTPIITPPPKKPPVKNSVGQPVSLKPQGIQKVSTVLKQYSTWALAAILAAPELYQMAALSGMLNDAAMPEHIMTPIRIVAGIGLVLKFVKQQKPAE